MIYRRGTRSWRRASLCGSESWDGDDVAVVDDRDRDDPDAGLDVDDHDAWSESSIGDHAGRQRVSRPFWNGTCLQNDSVSGSGCMFDHVLDMSPVVCVDVHSLSMSRES